MKMGVNLFRRTAEIGRLARAGVYHFQIARDLGVSDSLVQQTIKLLRDAGKLPLQKGPRAAVARVDWEAARRIWDDVTLTMAQAVASIGCSERTIYRRLGGRGRFVWVYEPVAKVAPPSAHHKEIQIQPVANPDPQKPIAPMSTDISRLDQPVALTQQKRQQSRGFSMSVMQGGDPYTDLRRAQAARASAGKV